MPIKTCSKCKQELPKEQFSKHKDNKDRLQAWCKKCKQAYGQVNKEELAIINKTWYIKNKENRLAVEKVYRKTHKKEIAAHKKQRSRTDAQFKLVNNLRTRLNLALRENHQTGSAVNNLGCSIKELKKYLESLFYPNKETGEVMSWDNYGSWHLDHIKPLSKFDLSVFEQLKEACNYKNLQPMWAKENISKGDKYEAQLTSSTDE